MHYNGHIAIVERAKSYYMEWSFIVLFGFWMCLLIWDVHQQKTRKADLLSYMVNESV